MHANRFRQQSPVIKTHTQGAHHNGIVRNKVNRLNVAPCNQPGAMTALPDMTSGLSQRVAWNWEWKSITEAKLCSLLTAALG